ncbi:hypothetical protein CRE_28382 [Caenorhabditis remanei]|uniref:Uncharacterized protein n=1 Tax=Caenorhabditis remanei TaxID=31234 RepID=E3LM24_CAERE|nr:hypothetical protein CRE_28382 [Caenorhabditis remanei]
MANRSAVLPTEEHSQRDTPSHHHEVSKSYYNRQENIFQPSIRTTAQYAGSTKKHVPVIDIESFPKENPKLHVPTQDARFSSDTQPSSRFSNNSQKKNERAQKNSFNLTSKKQSTYSDHIPVFHRSPNKDLASNKRASSKGNSKNSTKCIPSSQISSKSKLPPKPHAASGKIALTINDVGGSSSRNTKGHNIGENRLIKNQSLLPEPSYSDSETDTLNNNATEFQSDIDIKETATVDIQDFVETVDTVTQETETHPATDQLPIDSEIKTPAHSESPFVTTDDIETSSNCMDSPACVEQKTVHVTANDKDPNENTMSSIASTTQEADVSNASTYGNEFRGNPTNSIAPVTGKTMCKQQSVRYSIEAEILCNANQSAILKAPKAVNTKPVNTRASSKNRKSVPKQTEYDPKVRVFVDVASIFFIKEYLSKLKEAEDVVKRSKSEFEAKKKFTMFLPEAFNNSSFSESTLEVQFFVDVDLNTIIIREAFQQLYGRFNVRNVRVHYNNKGERLGSGTMVVVEDYTEGVKNWVPDRDWRALRMMPLRTRDMIRHSEAIVKIYLEFQSHILWTEEKIEVFIPTGYSYLWFAKRFKEKLQDEFHATDFKLVYDVNGQCMKVAIILLTYANAETLNKVLRCNEVFDPKLRIRMLEVVDKPIDFASRE